MGDRLWAMGYRQWAMGYGLWAMGDREWVMGKGFKELLVWQKARDLAVEVYTLTGKDCFRRDYGLTDQMQRSSVSVPSNIAEGDERDTDKDAIHFFTWTRGLLQN